MKNFLRVGSITLAAVVVAVVASQVSFGKSTTIPQEQGRVVSAQSSTIDASSWDITYGGRVTPKTTSTSTRP